MNRSIGVSTDTQINRQFFIQVAKYVLVPKTFFAVEDEPTISSILLSPRLIAIIVPISQISSNFIKNSFFFSMSSLGDTSMTRSAVFKCI